MTTLLAFVGRLMIAILFLVSGANKLMDIAGTEAMIQSAGLPAGLAIVTGLFEVIAGLALVFGVLTRFFAVVLAGFCLVSAFFFHNQIGDPMQAAMLLKNVAIAGGLLCLTALDTVRWSYDAMRDRRRSDMARLDAEQRAHDAEVRAARAEGAAAAAADAAHDSHAHDTRTRLAHDVAPDGSPTGTTARKRRWLF
jgi:putative oxidoreductase